MEYRERLEKKFELFWMKAFSETSFLMMMFASGMILNACSLWDAYQTLTKNGNRLAAISMLRMLVDNCLYTYGLILHNNKYGYLDAYWNNTLYKFRHKGNAMTGAYLKRALNEEYEKIEEYYNVGCSLVHPSRFYVVNSSSYTTKGDQIVEITHNFDDFNADNIDVAIEYVKNVFENLLERLASETHKYEAKTDSSWDWLLDKSEYTRFINIIYEDSSFRTQYDSFFDRIKTPVCYDDQGNPRFMDSKDLIRKFRALYIGNEDYLNKPESKHKSEEILNNE